ncbi:hypothetical protein Ancab_025894 [Ancistrocladus abbreviatus]
MVAFAAPPPLPTPRNDPVTEKIKQHLLNKGVYPTPKIIQALRKKHLQKSIRKSKRLAAAAAAQSQTQPLTDSQKQALAEELYFQTVSREYKIFNRTLDSKAKDPVLVAGAKMTGRPWERLEREKLRELASESGEYRGGNLNSAHLKELGQFFEERKREAIYLLLDDDIELEEGILERGSSRGYSGKHGRRADAEAIGFLVDRLGGSGVTLKDWKFSRLMRQSGLKFTEGQLLKIIGELGDRGTWRQAMDVVEWVYSNKEHRHYKSRFVYTKLLAVLGKARRPDEALQIFKLMRGDCHIYPDMAAYHSIAVTLGQAGLLRELVKIIESMKQKPSKRVKNVHRKNWDPTLQPDVVVLNSVLNACIQSHQWKGVAWVFEQLRKGGLKPNSATYGLAMEVMLHSGKYGLVHELFRKMKRSGEAPNALTYKVLVRTFWKEDKVDEAIDAVTDMEQRGIFGTASVYYELACCLCNKGRWQEGMIEIEKLKRLPHSKPLAVAFTGTILSSMDGGHVNDCISIFEHMKCHCAPNIGTINVMLEVYGRNDMFWEAKDLFEKTKRLEFGCGSCLDKGDPSLISDVFTYGSMLKASARAQQWEYFEYVYKEMSLSGCQLDQTKHAPLLLEASRAGKWHLLEHAFDSILEAGDIPHPCLFTEMVCQATLQGNYERAVTVVNAMAYAPFQVSKNAWMDLFEENKDRISRDYLKKLLDALCNCELAKEATASNLLRALHCLCGSNSPKSISAAATSNELNQNLPYHADSRIDQECIVIPKASTSAEQKSPADNQPEDGHSTHGMLTVSQPIGEHDDDDPNSISTFHVYAEDGKAGLHASLSHITDVIADVSTDTCGGKLVHPVICEHRNTASDAVQPFETQPDALQDSKESVLPSANEILEAWKESGKKGRIIFPFYHC